MMRYLFLLLCAFHTMPTTAQTFKQEQLQYSKVKTAYVEKEPAVKKMVAAKGLTLQNTELFIRIFKEEQQLEVWVKKCKTNEAYQKLVTYPVCSSSGVAGPKRKEGDYQVPEGFYHVNIFNPTSNYYLSLGVSYPNASDKILGVKNRLGGAIMIHGNCVTIGCIPITDELIKELYILAVEARNNGQKQIPIHIFPFRMSEQKRAEAKQQYNDAKLDRFWDQLAEGYSIFEKSNRLPVVTVDAKGNYACK